MAKRPSVRPRLEGETLKTVSFGRNVRPRPGVWDETSTCIGRIVQGRNVQEAKRLGRGRNGELDGEGAKPKRAKPKKGETSSYF